MDVIVVIAKAEGVETAFARRQGGPVGLVCRVDDIWNRDVFTIPSDIRLVLHARQRGAPTERDSDIQRKVVRIEPGFLFADIFFVELEFPSSVEGCLKELSVAICRT